MGRYWLKQGQGQGQKTITRSSSWRFLALKKKYIYIYIFLFYIKHIKYIKYFIKFRFWKQEKDNKPVHKKKLIRKIMKIISLLVIKDPLTNYKRQVSIGWQLHALVLYFASSFLLCSHIGCISENKWMKCDGVGLNSLYCC